MVGAKLGTEAINTSLLAGVIGFVLVLAFMIVVYRIPGLAASLALCLYVTVMIICLNLFNVTLTLYGVAGIILSIGMAVDANVIVFYMAPGKPCARVSRKVLRKRSPRLWMAM